jgi:hypothetical protein
MSSPLLQPFPFLLSFSNFISDQIFNDDILFFRKKDDEGYGFSVRGDAPVVVAGVETASLAHVSIPTRVADPDPVPNWIRIQSGQWIQIRIRIRNPDPDPVHKSIKNLEILCFEVLDVLFES